MNQKASDDCALLFPLMKFSITSSSLVACLHCIVNILGSKGDGNLYLR